MPGDTTHALIVRYVGTDYRRGTVPVFVHSTLHIAGCNALLEYRIFISDTGNELQYQYR
jgi:hypothetical protein